jgi:hypothetical protein
MLVIVHPLRLNSCCLQEQDGQLSDSVGSLAGTHSFEFQGLEHNVQLAWCHQVVYRWHDQK